MLNIEIILPTKGRASTHLPRFCDSVKKTAANINRVFMTAVVNAGDTHTQEYLARRPNVDVIIEDLAKPHLAELQNMGYNMSKFKKEVVFYGGDDMEFKTPGWDDMIEAEMARTNGWGLLAGDDGYLASQDKRCPVWFFASRKLVDAHADWGLSNPRYPREGSDVFWGDVVGAPLNLMVWLDGLTIEHHHSTRPEVGEDKTFHDLYHSGLPMPGYNGGAYWKDVRECQHRIVRAVKKLKLEATRDPVDTDMSPV